MVLYDLVQRYRGCKGLRGSVVPPSTCWWRHCPVPREYTRVPLAATNTAPFNSPDLSQHFIFTGVLLAHQFQQVNSSGSSPWWSRTLKSWYVVTVNVQGWWDCCSIPKRDNMHTTPDDQCLYYVTRVINISTNTKGVWYCWGETGE